jgi:hypothetical protein
VVKSVIKIARAVVVFYKTKVNFVKWFKIATLLSVPCHELRNDRAKTRLREVIVRS